MSDINVKVFFTHFGNFVAIVKAELAGSTNDVATYIIDKPMSFKKGIRNLEDPEIYTPMLDFMFSPVREYTFELSGHAVLGKVEATAKLINIYMKLVRDYCLEVGKAALERD